MAELDFETLKKAWRITRKEREDDLKTIAPTLASPDEIYIKRIGESPDELVVQFLGFENAVDDATTIPQVKRLIINWLKRSAQDVRLQPSDQNTMIVRVSKDLKFDESTNKFQEAAISVLRRDPKSNKPKRVYRCIGGKKSGRKVATPDNCLGVPDWNKKMKLNITKRTKPGHQAVAKKKTQLTNIMSKRIRKANQRVKKARGGL